MSDLTVISLGWGVQSFGLAAMVALGVLPPVDAAVHADTTHERSKTYEFARKWTPWLEERGVKVVTVKGDRAGVIENWTGTSVMIPARTTWEDGTESGLLRRQCTSDWKIRPLRRWIRENGGAAELWIGISMDEWERMKDSDVRYVTNRYPLFEMRYSRADVIRWLQSNGLEIPPKSSCVFCPYRNRAAWREIKLENNGDWQKAVTIDNMIRHKRPGYVCYLHTDLKPLEDVDVRNAQDHGQLELWPEECTGMCFL